MDDQVKEALEQALSKRAENFNELTVKAWEDENFKQELLSDPKTVFARESGQAVPDNYTIQVIEEKPGELKMVLPSNPAEGIAEEGELSDEVLEAVAGGKFALLVTRDGWALVSW